MIGELEDERRWARLREGILWALLFHLLLVSAATWIPRYVFRVPPVIDPFDAIKERKDLKYFDLPPDLVKKYQPKVEVKPVPQKTPQIDRKTLEALNKPVRPPPPSRSPSSPSCSSRNCSNRRLPLHRIRSRSPRWRPLNRKLFRTAQALPWVPRTPPTSFMTPCGALPATPVTARLRHPPAASPCIPAPAPAGLKSFPIRRASTSIRGCCDGTARPREPGIR